jgi:hypothetical protein
MQEGQLLMTQVDRDRLVTLKKAKRKLISRGEAAEELGVSVRQVQRLLDGLKQGGSPRTAWKAVESEDRGEDGAAGREDPDGAGMRFFRQGRIYRSDVVQNQNQSQNQIPGREPTASRWSAPSPGKRTRREDHALLIVRDEFRTGYSLIGLLASIARLRFTGTRRLTCTPNKPRGKATFLLCQGHDISTLP